MTLKQYCAIAKIKILTKDLEEQFKLLDNSSLWAECFNELKRRNYEWKTYQKLRNIISEIRIW